MWHVPSSGLAHRSQPYAQLTIPYGTIDSIQVSPLLLLLQTVLRIQTLAAPLDSLIRSSKNIDYPPMEGWSVRLGACLRMQRVLWGWRDWLDRYVTVLLICSLLRGCDDTTPSILWFGLCSPSFPLPPLSLSEDLTGIVVGIGVEHRAHVAFVVDDVPLWERRINEFCQMGMLRFGLFFFLSFAFPSMNALGCFFGVCFCAASARAAAGQVAQGPGQIVYGQPLPAAYPGQAPMQHQQMYPSQEGYSQHYVPPQHSPVMYPNQPMQQQGYPQQGYPQQGYPQQQYPQQQSPQQQSSQQEFTFQQFALQGGEDGEKASPASDRGVTDALPPSYDTAASPTGSDENTTAGL